jgi:hypothetical protein
MCGMMRKMTVANVVGIVISSLIIAIGVIVITIRNLNVLNMKPVELAQMKHKDHNSIHLGHENCRFIISCFRLCACDC